MVATPAGINRRSNLRPHGPILPLVPSFWRLTPVSAFRPGAARRPLLAEQGDRVTIDVRRIPKSARSMPG